MSKHLNTFRAAIAAGVLAFPMAAIAEETSVDAPSDAPLDASVVLVHGAFSDGSVWHRVIPILQEAGISVRAAQLPLASLQGDADVVSRLLDMQKGPVVLVGHSYGGNVITVAGVHENVDALVYVAGFALDAGQSLTDLLEGQPAAPWQAEARRDAAGFVRLSADGIATFFAPDLPAEETALIAATQGPIQYQINYEAPSVAAWSMHPTYYVMTENDQIVPPRLQGYFAKRMEAEVTRVASSHVVMLSQPEAVAEVILKAVARLSAE
ncbi:MAG: alpha/beta hydrolase [Pseudomonadota bacterium]